LNLQRFWAVFIARNREFLRDRSSLGWNLFMPICLVVGLAVTFSGDGVDLYKVGVYGAAPGSDAFLATEHIQFIDVETLAAAITKVERHQLDMLYDPGARRYWINQNSARGYLLERVLRGSSDQALQQQTVSGREIRYVDWVLPGVLAMNVSFSALFGVGYVIVRYRKNGMLKRLKATPLSAFEFLSAQVASRLWLIVTLTSVVYLGTDYLLEFSMFGSYLDLLIVFALGALSLISLAMVLAARTASEELASGLLNIISWPMVFLSGVWFSLDGSPPILQQIALFFPLTHLVDSARAIMIDGAGLVDISGHLLALMVMSGIFMAIGSYGFRWE